MKSLVMASTALCLCTGAAYAWSPVDKTEFKLVPANAAILDCLAADGKTSPVAKVVVRRENLNDTLTIHVTGLKPNLQFDLFTVERSPFLADGAPDPNFPKTFGLAWYQSDLDADEDGTADIQVKKPLRSIFLDQIFGFDGDKKTGRYHYTAAGKYIPCRILVQQSRRCQVLRIRRDQAHTIQW